MAEYDPTADGAECARCPLRRNRAGGPVKSEMRTNAIATILAEAPGDVEAKEGAPLVGPSGIELQKALGALGMRRPFFNYVNTLSCVPPTLDGKKNNLRGYLHRIQKANKGKEKEAAETGKPFEPIADPRDCCRPRLLKELALNRNLITLGGTAYQAIAGSATAITEVRGGPVEIVIDGLDSSHRVLPTLHPAAVLRARRWTQAFRADLGRAVRWFRTGLGWRDPESLFQPSAAQLDDFFALARTQQFTVCDVETAPAFPRHGAFEPMLDPLRCIGFCTADGKHAVVVPFRSKVDGKPFYAGNEAREIFSLVQSFLADKSVLKAGHNFGYYDAQVIKHEFGVDPTPLIDSIGLHKFAEPELPHGLGYVGSIYTDVNAWKQGHTATEAETDEELWRYNVKDTAVDALAIPQLVKAVQERKQLEACKFWHRVVQPVTVGLHRNGIRVDQKKREEWDLRLLKEARAAREECRAIAAASGMRNFNPGSTDQLRDLLFTKWDLIPHDYTELGDPSTNDDSLRAFLMTYDLTAAQHRLVSSTRTYREKVKLRGTYVVKLRPVDEVLFMSDLAWDEEESLAEREQRYKKMLDRPGKVLSDGRVHADWNGTGTVGWRLSSSGPNMQNVPNLLRDMFVPAEGNVFVGCDQAQLELRMVAGMAGASHYLAAFNENRDPHLALCQDFFGGNFESAGKDQKKALRVFAKQFTYACAARGTKVVTLGPEGTKSIEDLVVGRDFTWTWDGEKYTPSRIVEKKCHGLRPCVRVRMKWSMGESEAIFTDDHHFMLRDGTYRQAADLRPSDSLMPFWRWEIGPYRMIDRYNDGGREGEHRAICDLAPGDLRVVHHIDERGVNNHPDNLEVIDSAGAHSRLHWDDERRVQQSSRTRRAWLKDPAAVNARLTAGRISSSAWREANAVNYEKMRSGLDQRRALGKVPYKTHSVLDAMLDKVGVLTDREIAKLAGVSPSAVSYFRRSRHIPAPPGQRHNHAVVSVEPAGMHEVWDIEVDHPAHNFALAAGIFVHNSLYMAGDETKYEILTSAEDQETKSLLYPNLTLREVAAFSRKWLDRNPEIEIWWESIINEWRRQGYLTEPIFGQRCDFLDGEEPNKLTNFKAQSGGAAIVHLAEERVLDRIPFEKWGPGTGLVINGHDQLVVECPVGEAEWVAKYLEECMTFQGRQWGLGLKFTGESQIGKTWKDA